MTSSFLENPTTEIETKYLNPEINEYFTETALKLSEQIQSPETTEPEKTAASIFLARQIIDSYAPQIIPTNKPQGQNKINQQPLKEATQYLQTILTENNLPLYSVDFQHKPIQPKFTPFKQISKPELQTKTYTSKKGKITINLPKRTSTSLHRAAIQATLETKKPFTQINSTDQNSLKKYILQSLAGWQLLKERLQKNPTDFNPQTNEFTNTLLTKIIEKRANMPNSPQLCRTGYHCSKNRHLTQVAQPDQDGNIHFATIPDKLCVRNAKSIYLVERPSQNQITNAQLGWYTTRSNLNIIAELDLNKWANTFNFRCAKGYTYN